MAVIMNQTVSHLPPFGSIAEGGFAYTGEKLA
jgi:hypothetical protein